jgi:hypothetical protein
MSAMLVWYGKWWQGTRPWQHLQGCMQPLLHVHAWCRQHPTGMGRCYQQALQAVTACVCCPQQGPWQCI